MQLETLIERSSTYVRLLKDQMDKVRISHRRRETKPPSAVKTKNARKRARVLSDSEDEPEAKRVKAETTSTVKDAQQEAAVDGKYIFEQPALITGATLKDYQLEGVAWMAGLYQNGISGILGTS